MWICACVVALHLCPHLAQLTLHWVQWWCRYAGTAAAMFVYIREWWSFVDLLNHNSRLLNDIHGWVKQQQQLQQQQKHQQSQTHQHGGFVHQQPQTDQHGGFVRSVCSHCCSPVAALGPAEFQKNSPQIEAYCECAFMCGECMGVCAHVYECVCICMQFLNWTFLK